MVSRHECGRLESDLARIVRKAESLPDGRADLDLELLQSLPDVAHGPSRPPSNDRLTSLVINFSQYRIGSMPGLRGRHWRRTADTIALLEVRPHHRRVEGQVRTLDSRKRPRHHSLPIRSTTPVLVVAPLSARHPKGMALYALKAGDPAPPKRLEPDGFDQNLGDLAPRPMADFSSSTPTVEIGRRDHSQVARSLYARYYMRMPTSPRRLCCSLASTLRTILHLASVVFLVGWLSKSLTNLPTISPSPLPNRSFQGSPWPELSSPWKTMSSMTSRG